MTSCKVLVTGSKGFIAKNLMERLRRVDNIEIVSFNKADDVEGLAEKIAEVDFVFHLAGVNRPESIKEFYTGNRDLTQSVVDAVIKSGRKVPILMTSSTQAESDNDYGRSKLAGEEILKSYNRISLAPVFIYRLPNVFGKGCRPNYNSVVATWCYNIASGLPIQVNDETVTLALVYVNEVVVAFIKHLGEKPEVVYNYYKVMPVYYKSLAQIRELLYTFKQEEFALDSLNGFDRALYDTYQYYAGGVG